VIGKFSLSHCTCAKKVYRFFTLNTWSTRLVIGSSSWYPWSTTYFTT
jgi:hypothetical protein